MNGADSSGESVPAAGAAAQSLWRQRTIDAVRVARWLTRVRLMQWGVGLAVAAIVVLARDVVVHTAHGLTAVDGSQLAGDFAAQFAGAKAAATGLGAMVYDRPFFNGFVAAVVGPSTEQKFYPFPPFTMLLTLPLAPFSFIPALILYVAAGFLSCWALLRRSVDWPMAAVALIAAPAAFLNLYYAQNGYFTAALLAGGLMALERRPAIAGICFGCLAYKPQIALLLPFVLAAGGHWRAFVAAALTLAGLVLISAAAFGTAAWTGFLSHMSLYREILEQGAGVWPFRPAVFTAARQLRAPVGVAYLAQSLSAVAAVATSVVVWRGPASSDIKAAVIVVATFLATPYAWDYDGVALVFAAAWLGRAATRSGGGFLPWERVAVLGLLIWPALAIAATRLAGIPLAPIILWLGFAAIVRRAGVASGATAAPSAVPV